MPHCNNLIMSSIDSVAGFVPVPLYAIVAGYIDSHIDNGTNIPTGSIYLIIRFLQRDHSTSFWQVVLLASARPGWYKIVTL